VTLTLTSFGQNWWQ